MFPAQTSLIPIQIALARFLENQGLSAVFANYPYWYLGTTPFRYLTGPILPSLLVGIHKIFPGLSLFSIFYLLFTIFWLIGGVGVYLLVASLANSRGVPLARLTAFLAAFFYLFGPILPLLFRFSDGLYLIAFSFLPYTLLTYLRLLKKWTVRTAILSMIMISFLILLDSLIVPSLLLGMAAIFLAQVGWKKVEEKIKQTLLVLSCSFLVATFWYSPGYWLTLLGAPSLAGMGVVRVIGWLGKLLPTALAFAIAIFSIKFFKKRNLLRDFCFYWLFIFGFLTLIRFLSDPAFWLDWSAYGTELQLGIAMALGIAIFKTLNSKLKIYILNLKSILIFLCLFTIYFLQFTIMFNKYVLGTLQRDITQSVEYRIGRQLSQIAKPGERVFLSGTTTFWLNAFFDIKQVRGGRDQVAVHPTWRQAVWEIREGVTTEGTERWLKTLNISYLVVHTQESEEFYHDFSNPEKFEEIPSLKKIYDKDGDRIYKVLSF